MTMNTSTRSDHAGPSFTSPSSASLLPSLSTSPSRQSPNSQLNSHPSLGVLTPSSSRASLSPGLSSYKDIYQLPSPALSPDLQLESNHPPRSRRLFFPVRASLDLFKQPAHSTTTTAYMPEVAVSRPTSPARRSRAMSPRRSEHRPQPQSRCESLLRNTLRRADEQERSLAHRTVSRSPTRWTRGRPRPRDNSFLEALRRDDSPDSDCDVDKLVWHINGRDSCGNRDRTQAMAIRGRGAMSASPTDGGSVTYGSPSSPSPIPPIMMRTRTAPTVPRVKGNPYDDEQRAGLSRSPASPQAGRRSLPNTVSHSHASMAPSNEASPKQRMNTLSPHESVLRAKLEYVLQKAGSPSADESSSPSQITGRQRRNHQRAFSHGVTSTVVISPKRRDDASPVSSSPQSFASSSSNSATDLARVNPTPRRRNSVAYRTSSSSPAEPLTPPPTPPFNARTASEVCKRIDGYVSFASVEGLGEPPGLDMDSDDNEEGVRKLGRWLRMLPVFRNGGQGTSEHEGGQVIVNRHRSGSTSGSS